MRHVTRSFGLCALAVLALGVGGTATATAATYPLTELPEIGRCVPAPGNGGFKGKSARCTVKSPTHTGNWEWEPGPGAKGTVNEVLNGPVLETTKNGRISCHAAFLTGEVTSGKTERFTNLTLQGCLLVGPNLPCYSNFVEPGTIESNGPFVGELGFIPGSKTAQSWVGWDLKPESELSNTIVEFQCGEAKPVPVYTVKIEGSVIGRTKPLNKMVTSLGLIYKQAAGIQNPTAFTGGVEDVLKQITTPTLNPTEPKEEQVGLATGGEMALGEALEVRGKER